MLNVSLEKFSYLTGRGLASFKRDFEKADAKKDYNRRFINCLKRKKDQLRFVLKPVLRIILIFPAHLKSTWDIHQVRYPKTCNKGGKLLQSKY